MRQAFPNITDVVKLTKGSCFLVSSHEDVETRMFTKERGKTVKSYGPFEEDLIDKLSNPFTKNWTMLIQEVDRHMPKVADLWQSYFPFIPRWRRDDVMISYSTEGGGIGAHVDNYDVFLLQGSGSREWAIEHSYLTDKEEKIREIRNSDTRLLRDFSCDQRWTMAAGDLLYLPPRIPHRGVTLASHEDCTTISFGFRAPNFKTLLTAFWEEVTGPGYIDPSLLFHSDIASSASGGKIEPLFDVSGGLITQSAIESMESKLQKLVSGPLRDSSVFNRWLCKHLTAPLRYSRWSAKPFFIGNKSDKDDDDNEDDNDDYDDDDNTIVNKGSVDDVDVDVDNDDDDNDDDDDVDFLPLFLQSPYRMATFELFESAEEVLSQVLAGKFTLRRCEGVRMAYTSEAFYVDGEEFPFPAIREGGPSASKLGSVLCDHNVIDKQLLCSVDNQILKHARSSAELRFLAGLVRSGYFYPVDVKK